MNDLINFLQESRYVVVFTGAGVSTLSGIPDFRGKDGIYKRLDADRVFALEYFRRDPSMFYRHARDFIYALDDAEPNLVHHECARLEQKGIVREVITQNIDMLHQKAGSQTVHELHGSPANHLCLECGQDYTFTWAKNLVRQDVIPSCEKCGGLVKPDVTFFGEMLPEIPFHQAVTAATKADLILVLGSSLVVHPAASLPLITVEKGGQLIIINADPTPLDGHASCRYDDLENCFEHIATVI
jgi:NAD-dependent deacetylase